MPDSVMWQTLQAFRASEKVSMILFLKLWRPLWGADLHNAQCLVMILAAD